MQNLSQSSNNKMQAIIRTYPGRVLKITVLSQYKRPLSFDACSPPSPCGKRRSVSDDQDCDEAERAAKRARLLTAMNQSSDTARSICALFSVRHASGHNCSTKEINREAASLRV
ncbi:hypothetical protein GUITHDRAFT_155072 [Guillardia theta CCMP2712]|uniref:Uncharacterized protein n=1 Tax=Guillardia theta (strain CCMP2712) TaxID=905079 RepID=L1ILG3_GUITC|nr:hypothetical protein GUITHDRAFT_155072 [Guillardia theta CCMP2712]EKX37086.1 hypothetical protein GUITHDRAFT_155072 [Guillardia theta CCMP2712]|mmetsp:Transcript_39936/g.125446  ORF Transcript_39936/g.125446 Transcript_39936/m.125446 type:complete len:114 (-) Transcript_39936:660-1001(-)|eukprot:XP_005824066.1 hypothetical protein GUITHDRAFT_155072 [Guillardia theta CCMP2712]